MNQADRLAVFEQVAQECRDIMTSKGLEYSRGEEDCLSNFKRVAMLLQLAASRQNMNPATNPGSRWLFPGRRAGQPLHPATMAALLGEFGLPTRAALTATLRQLVLQAPAPVVSRALGYPHNAAHRHAAQAAGPWARYASGDHSQ